jgi:hypothetical protein
MSSNQQAIDTVQVLTVSDTMSQPRQYVRPEAEKKHWAPFLQAFHRNAADKGLKLPNLSPYPEMWIQEPDDIAQCALALTPELTAFYARTLVQYGFLTDKTNNCCGDLPEYFSIEGLATCFSDPNESTRSVCLGILRTVIEERHTLGIQAIIVEMEEFAHMDHSSEVVTCDGQGPAEAWLVNVWNILSHVPQEIPVVMHEFYQTMALETDRCLQAREDFMKACSLRGLSSANDSSYLWMAVPKSRQEIRVSKHQRCADDDLDSMETDDTSPCMEASDKRVRCG